MSVIGSAAAAKDDEMRHELLQVRIILAGLNRIAIIKFFCVIQFRVAQP